MGEIYIGTPNLKKLYAGVPNAKKIYIGTGTTWLSEIPVERPSSLSVSANYSGQEITNGYITPNGVTMVGDNKGTNGGIYTATYTPDQDHVWSDTGDRVPVTVTLTISYVWTKWDSVYRYSVVTETITATSNNYVLESPGMYERLQGWGTSYNFNSTTGRFSLNGLQTRLGGERYYWASDFIGNLQGQDSDYSNDLPYVYNSPTSNIHYVEYGKLVLPYAGDWCYKYSSVGAYTKGDVNYGNVSSTTLEYPENGRHTDGYWYVKTW